MSDKIFKVYEGTVDAFKATSLPTTYADRPVFIEGDASGNGRAIFANGEYYANGDAMSERGWRFVKWNSGTSTEYWNRIAKIDALKNSNILLECAVKGEFGYSAAVCFYIDVSSSPSDRITVSVHGGASSIGYNNGSITPMVTVDADLNVWLKLHNMNYTSRAAIRVIYRTGNAEAYGHFGTNESSTSYVYQLAAPASTYLEGYGGLRYTISSGTYTLTGAVIDATATDANKLGGVDASGYAKTEEIDGRKYVYAQGGLADDQIIYSLPTSKNGTEDDTLVSENSLKTINGQSLVGSGDITIEGGGGSSSGSGEVYITPFTVDQFCTGYVELTDEQRNELINAASQNRIIGMPYMDAQAGCVIADYSYSSSLDVTGDDFYRLLLGVIYNGAHYSNFISSGDADSNFVIHRRSITPFKPLMYGVNVEDGVAIVADDASYTDNCVFAVVGECSELCVYLEPSDIGKTVRFFTGESCTLEIGAYVCWANGEVPTIEPYTHYELSLVSNIDGGFNAVLTPFKPVE